MIAPCRLSVISRLLIISHTILVVLYYLVDNDKTKRVHTYAIQMQGFSYR
jgi:hypothetical protein